MRKSRICYDDSMQIITRQRDKILPDDAISSKSFGDDVVNICPGIPNDEFAVVINEWNGNWDQCGLDTAANTAP